MHPTTRLVTAAPSVGGLYNENHLTVTGSSFSDNVGNYGAGLMNDGLMSVEHSALSGNQASIQGGGIYNEGMLGVDYGSIDRNSAAG
jgi:hypothetical protein